MLKHLETDEYWKDVLGKLSKHKGTIVGFCKKHDVNVHRLYHRRKNFKTKPEPTFHAIDLNNVTIREDIVTRVENTSPPSTEIRIEVGKAKIYIANTDKISLSTVIKEIVVNC